MIYAFVPYIGLSVCLAVLAQSASAGIAIALGYYVIELIVAPILTVTVSGQRITDFLLRNNIDEWMDSAFISVEINGTSSTASQPEALQAFLVILAYTLVFCIAAFLRVSAPRHHRREGRIAGPANHMSSHSTVLRIRGSAEVLSHKVTN